MRYAWHKIRWINSVFLIGTFTTTLIAVPLYLLQHGIDAFQAIMFIFFFFGTGMSITLGYHRLFSHLTFHASWPVKMFVLLFGAAAFEGSALGWCADHRRHHKFVDHDDDPYDISKGFWHAHIGWLLFRTGADTPLTWVRDLQKDRLAWWQHEFYVPLALGMGFAFPAFLGYLWGGWQCALGMFLLSGVARVVLVHHMTFCINSLCHWIGDRPYSSKCSARDSFFMAIFTFGEGYHNFHHEFQYDYRNGVKPWQYDPTKWAIWALDKVGLVKGLRTVPEEKILKAQIAEQQELIAAQIVASPGVVSDSLHAMVHSAQERMHDALASWEQQLVAYREAAERGGEVSRRHLRELKRSVDEAMARLRAAVAEWNQVCRQVFSRSAAA